MICGVHGSPGNSVTEPTWSKRTPAGTALTCAAGFLICAQPAIPARAAPAITQLNNSFFISTESRTPRGRHLPPHFEQSDLARKISGKISCITPLQVRALPIFTGENFPAIRHAAVALQGIIVVGGHRPSVGEFFANTNVAHRDKRDLASHPEIRVA